VALLRVQHATVDLVNVGDAVEAEKDALLLRFFALARHACDALAAAGHWADYIDPCSGLPVRQQPLVRLAAHSLSASHDAKHLLTASAAACAVDGAQGGRGHLR
jgi:hypothetical protein